MLSGAVQGSTKAAVLPVPVWAPPSRSWPSRTDWNGLGLDGGGGFVALLAHGLENGRSQLQIFKIHGEVPVPGHWGIGLFRAFAKPASQRQMGCKGGEGLQDSRPSRDAGVNLNWRDSQQLRLSHEPGSRWPDSRLLPSASLVHQCRQFAIRTETREAKMRGHSATIFSVVCTMAQVCFNLRCWTSRTIPQPYCNTAVRLCRGRSGACALRLMHGRSSAGWKLLRCGTDRMHRGSPHFCRRRARRRHRPILIGQAHQRCRANSSDRTCSRAVHHGGKDDEPLQNLARLCDALRSCLKIRDLQPKHRNCASPTRGGAGGGRCACRSLMPGISTLLGWRSSPAGA
jgi:hypothetical protein